MNKQIYYIYTLSDPITKEIKYIGKTKDLKDRFKRHMSDYSLRDYWTSKNKWILYLKKLDKLPIMEILDEGDIDNIDDLEKYWIQQLVCWGFKLKNETIGGDGFDWTGRKHSKVSSDRMKMNHPFRKTILQFDLNNNFINYFLSSHDASNTTNLHRGHIVSCCNKKINHHTCGGYYFRFLDNYFPCEKSKSLANMEYIEYIIKDVEEKISLKIDDIKIIKEKITHINSKVYIHYDLNGNILNTFNSLSEAYKKTGIHQYLISNCCKKKGSYTVGGGHFWRKSDENLPTTFRYKGDIFDYVPYNKNIQKNSKSVCKYDLEGNLIQTYDSIKNAADNNNTSDQNIISCLKRKINKKTGKFIVVKGHTYRLFSETNGEDLNTQ